MSLNVVKVGGAVIENADRRRGFLRSFAGLAGDKILVHGGGRTATALASRLGIETKMSEGRRITDAPMLEVVTMVYGGLVNKSTVAALQSLGVNAVGLTGADLHCMKAHKRPAGTIDYGYVGDVDEVDQAALSMFLDNGAVPVIAPLSFSPEDGLLNTNADTIATEVARAMAVCIEGVTLTFCFEKDGILADPEDDSSVIAEIDRKKYQELKASGVVSGGMIPKLDNAFHALESGVASVVITNADNLGRNSGTLIRL